MPDFSQYNVAANPFSVVANKLSGVIKNSTTTGQMVLKHGMGLEAASHQNALDKDLASHQGQIQSGLSAQDHNQRMKEGAASRRHEVRMTVLNHNNSLEAKAVDHHLGVERMRTESGLRSTEAGAAHANATDLINRLNSVAKPGSNISFAHGDINAKFTLNKPETAAPQQTGTPVHIMNNPNTPAAPATEAVPAKAKMYAYNHPVTGKIAYSETPGGPKGSVAKKAAPKKAAPKKGRGRI
jgi:hypothetical protein